MQTLQNVMQCLHCSTGNCEHDKRQVFIRKNETVKFGPHHTFILGFKTKHDWIQKKEVNQQSLLFCESLLKTIFRRTVLVNSRFKLHLKQTNFWWEFFNRLSRHKCYGWVWSRELSQAIKSDRGLVQEFLDDFEKFLVIRHCFKFYFFEVKVSK